ncbi:MAG: M56 family metallopeptidase [Pseudohongiellaceae bacterium]
MGLLATPDALIASFLAIPGAAILLDLLIKSLVVLLVVFLLAGVASFKLQSRSRYLIWTVGMLSLPVLAGIELLIRLVPGDLPDLRSLIVIPVNEQFQSAGSLSQKDSIWGWWLVAVYLGVALLLVGRLAWGLYQVRCVRRESLPSADVYWDGRLESISRNLGITRPVALGVHPDIRTPVSFGFRRPMVALPEQAVHWDANVLEDVLVHELCHIRRFDWVALVIAQTAACLFWANPLVWWAMRCFHREAEYSCDADVVASGRNDCDYARSLLFVAQCCLGAGSLPRQKFGMISQSVTGGVLRRRLQRILRAEVGGVSALREYRAIALLLTICIGTLLFALATTNVIALPDSSQMGDQVDLYPLADPRAQAHYPEQARQNRQEGTVQVRFSVDESGRVPRDSIEIVKADPSGVFDQSAIEATAAVEYRPKVIDGVPVPVSGVQYVFRYELEDL